jgi:hypothetical protein
MIKSNLLLLKNLIKETPVIVLEIHYKWFSFQCHENSSLSPNGSQPFQHPSL